MKKTILAVAMLIAGAVSAQKGYYVSVGAGLSGVANAKLLSTSEGALKGSYGDGFQAQLRGGYFFNDKIGIDLGVGYLAGDDQQIRNDYLKINARAKAFGAALTGVYNFSENVYVRGGVLTKIGGKSVAEGTLDLPTPAGSLHVEFDRDNKGKLPVGFIGAFGVKFKLADNWGIFAEMEYQGIDVTPEKSTLTRFKATLNGADVPRERLLALAPALVGGGAIKAEDLLSISDEFTYSDNPDSTQRKEFDAPYSSFGVAVGVTYFF